MRQKTDKGEAMKPLLRAFQFANAPCHTRTLRYLFLVIWMRVRNRDKLYRVGTPNPRLSATREVRWDRQSG